MSFDEERNEAKRNDAIDFLIESFQEVKDKQNLETGQMERVSEFNPKIAWYQGHNINASFGRYAMLIERWENLATKCFSMMSPEPAAELAKDILLKLNEHKRSVDAKSSETWRDKDNSQSSVFQILANKKVEKVYTVHGDAKRSFMDGILGKDVRKEQEEQ